jgi:pimeloyl-ACP methyl ester carboxylesterase
MDANLPVVEFVWKNIQKTDVLGYSLGSFVAQQLTLAHPEKVNRLILLSASCGGKDEGIRSSSKDGSSKESLNMG